MSHPIIRPFLALAFLSLTWSCGGAGGGASAPALPAARTQTRTLIGTWKTAVPTSMSFSTDSCSNAPTTMTLAGTEPWTVLWVITAGTDENHVNVQMTFTRGAFTSVTPTACASPILVQETSPMELSGVISFGQLKLFNGATPAGVFTFTADNLTGTFDYTYTGIYSQREYSATNGMILLRQ
jgi:hypothetical protein